MAADPNAAAQALAGQTYASAQQRTAAGKQALLDQMTTQGTYGNDINHAVVNAASNPTLSAQKASPADNQTPAQTGQTDAVNAFNQGAVAAAAALAAHHATAQQQAASTYFGQVGAAIPVEQSRAQSQAGQIMEQLISDREQRANQLALEKLQLQEAQASLANTQASGASRLASANTLSPDEQLAVEQNAKGIFKSDPNLNYKGSPNRTASLAVWLSQNQGATSAQIDAYAKKLGIDDAHTQYAVQAANNYFQNLAGHQYYGTGTPPVIQWAPAAPAPYAGLTGQAAESLLYTPGGSGAGVASSAPYASRL